MSSWTKGHKQDNLASPAPAQIAARRCPPCRAAPIPCGLSSGLACVPTPHTVGLCGLFWSRLCVDSACASLCPFCCDACLRGPELSPCWPRLQLAALLAESHSIPGHFSPAASLAYWAVSSSGSRPGHCLPGMVYWLPGGAGPVKRREPRPGSWAAVLRLPAPISKGSPTWKAGKSSRRLRPHQPRARSCVPAKGAGLPAPRGAGC